MGGGQAFVSGNPQIGNDWKACVAQTAHDTQKSKMWAHVTSEKYEEMLKIEGRNEVRAKSASCDCGCVWHFGGKGSAR